MKPSMRKTSLVGEASRSWWSPLHRECRTRKGCTELRFLVQSSGGASRNSKLPVEVSFSGIIMREYAYLDATNEAGNFSEAIWRSPALSRRQGGENVTVIVTQSLHPTAE